MRSKYNIDEIVLKNVHNNFIKLHHVSETCQYCGSGLMFAHHSVIQCPVILILLFGVTRVFIVDT